MPTSAGCVPSRSPKSASPPTTATTLVAAFIMLTTTTGRPAWSPRWKSRKPAMVTSAAGDRDPGDGDAVQAGGEQRDEGDVGAPVQHPGGDPEPARRGGPGGAPEPARHQASNGGGAGEEGGQRERRGAAAPELRRQPHGEEAHGHDREANRRPLAPVGGRSGDPLRPDEHDDGSGRHDALHDRERGEGQRRDVEGEPAVPERRADPPAPRAQHPAHRVDRAPPGHRRQRVEGDVLDEVAGVDREGSGERQREAGGDVHRPDFLAVADVPARSRRRWSRPFFGGPARRETSLPCRVAQRSEPWHSGLAERLEQLLRVTRA